MSVTALAFTLRDDEEYLSGSWLEFFDGASLSDRLARAVEDIACYRKVYPKDAFAVLNAGRIRSCGTAKDRRLRVRSEPAVQSDAYAVIRGLRPEDMSLLEILAIEAVINAQLVKNLPVNLDGTS
ncbi:MAG: hypothetical protein JNM30_19220 [Rhodospirillales bacterium]|nr:hypothetical protein [Rhodospirillales bacterium]